MSESKYILIYPFESRERAFEVGNDIDGSLMWQNGTAYPRDNIPALIVPLSEFSGRWTAPNQAKELKQESQRLKQGFVDVSLYVENCQQEMLPVEAGRVLAIIGTAIAQNKE